MQPLGIRHLDAWPLINLAPPRKMCSASARGWRQSRFPNTCSPKQAKNSQTNCQPSLRSIASDEFAWRETVAELHKVRAVPKRNQHQRRPCWQSQTMQSPACTLHRLSQAAMRTKCVALGGTALLLVSAVFPYYADDPEHWPRCRTLQAHAYHLQQVYQASWQKAQASCLPAGATGDSI